uniref:Trafficking protein particle complex subunit 12-like n=1 Tax=Cynoglossus semilaevis TaxID=244447 RepID=A0A3P8V8E9_CYNSE
MDTDKQTNTQEEATTSVSPEDGTQFDVKGEEKAPKADPGAGSKEEPVPVCTIFSQGSHPKSLVPDGFQPTLIKSPSFSIGSGGGSNEAVTPSKLATPLVCQPSPSLSKFFTENEHVNPASDFFDSFTVPSSFISISNPNADVPPDTQSAPTVPTPDPSGETTSTPTQAPVSSPVSQPQTFNQLQAVFSGNDDPFATALSLSEVDRRHDAWLPSEETRKVLISVATQQYSPSFVDTNRLTMPGLKFDNLQVGHVVQFQTCSFIKSIPFFVSYDVSFYALRNLQCRSSKMIVSAVGYVNEKLDNMLNSAQHELPHGSIPWRAGSLKAPSSYCQLCGAVLQWPETAYRKSLSLPFGQTSEP